MVNLLAVLLGLLGGWALWRLGTGWATMLSDEDAGAPEALPPRAAPLDRLRSNSFQETLFVAGCGAYAGLVAARFGDAPPAVARVLLLATPLLLILLVDARTRLIPHLLLAAGAALGLALAAAEGIGHLLGHAAAGLAAALVFGALWKLAAVVWGGLAETPFGEGDVLLAGVIGAIVGPGATIQALFLGALLAGAAALVGLLARRVARTDVLPYGPFLCLGALVALLR